MIEPSSDLVKMLSVLLSRLYCNAQGLIVTLIGRYEHPIASSTEELESLLDAAPQDDPKM